jgi:hypothetical protein
MTKVSIFSHDAGAAELISSYVLKNQLQCHFVLEGPALKIFKKKFSIELTKFSEAFNDCELVITGTSASSFLEWNAIKESKNRGIRVVTILDHWVGYEGRFIRNGIRVFPDELWVVDEYAYKIAKKVFPSGRVLLIDNPYFNELLHELNKNKRCINKNLGLKILFVCEPLSKQNIQSHLSGNHLPYDEFDAIRFFSENIHVLGMDTATVKIRPHPSDEDGKYLEIAKELGPNFSVGGNKSLIDEIIESDIIVGCESMALIVGLLAQKIVISSIPFGGRPCSLPHKGIINIQVLLGKQNKLKQ